MTDPTKTAQHTVICELQGENTKLRKELDEIATRLRREVLAHHDTAAKCAEMKEALKQWVLWYHNDENLNHCIKLTEHAVSLDCGRGWVRVGELKDVLADLEPMKLANLFVAWPLPNTVCCDRCAIEPNYPNRVGTNLLSVVEASQMFTDTLASIRSRLEKLIKNAQ